MKSNIWIFLLISITSYIGATSNESTTAAAKFILSSSPSTLTSSRARISSIESNGDILISGNIFSSSNMSTTASSSTYNHQNTITSSHSLSSSSLNYYESIHQKSNNNSQTLHNKNVESVKTKRSLDKDNTSPECEPFTIGEDAIKTFYSPGYPKEYTKNISCVRVIEAPSGFLIRLDFRDYFQIEPSDECKFDYLEIRDGAHGFSTSLGQFCGHNFPDMITSKDRFLWLRFNSDENIEDKGFKAVYEFIPRPTSVIYDETECIIHVNGSEGWVNHTMVNQQKLEYVKRHNLSLDCMFIITVEETWKILLKFVHFELKKPNECERNFIDIFPEKTDLPSRIKNFCGSMADIVESKVNIVHIRYFAEASAINSTFAILFTAFRPKGDSCAADEYDCEDLTCIKAELKCNDRENCRFKWDESEDECKNKNADQSEHVFIIIIVFGVILTILSTAFVINCIRKIVRDHKIIREHIRQSRESKLDELGRHSTKLTKSRENIALAQLTKIPPPSFDLESPTSINLIDHNTNNHQYYRDAMSANNGARIIDSKNDLNLREQEIKNILGASYDVDVDRKDAEMCDSACQTSEWKEKEIIEDDEESDTVTFDMKNTFVYRPDLTKTTSGLTGDEIVTIPHLLIMGGLIAIQRDMKPLLGIAIKAMTQIFDPTTPFLTARVMDILFDGVPIDCNHDEFEATTFCSKLESEKGFKIINETHLAFSILGGANATSMGRFKVYRGVKDISKLGEVVSVNDEEEMDVWDGDCNKILGTDSTM
ncbi:hypothetical protein ACKWTF_007190 [Chironomus riparius]